MTQDQLEILCHTLKLGKPIAHIGRVYGGLLHKMWRLDTDQGTFAIKQLSKSINLNEQTRKSYELTELIARQFASQDIPSVFSITHDGLSLVDAGDDTFIVYPWVIGKPLTWDEINVESATKIAKLIAKIHAINLVISDKINPTYDVHSNEKIDMLITKSLEANLSFAENLVNTKDLLFELNSKYQNAFPAFNNELVISHGDLDPKNVLWDETCNPVLIDWESSRLVNPTYDIVNAALDWSGITTGFINEEIFEIMIKTYINSGGTINSDLLMNIFYGINGNWINWLYYNIIRSINGTSLEEKNLGAEQVAHTLKTIIYLHSKTLDLIKIIRTCF